MKLATLQNTYSNGRIVGFNAMFKNGDKTIFIDYEQYGVALTGGVVLNGKKYYQWGVVFQGYTHHPRYKDYSKFDKMVQKCIDENEETFIEHNLGACNHEC